MRPNHCCIMEEIRWRIVSLMARGERPTDISRQLMIVRSTVYSVKKLYKETGGFSRRPSIHVGLEQFEHRTSTLKLKLQSTLNPTKTFVALQGTWMSLRRRWGGWWGRISASRTTSSGKHRSWIILKWENGLNTLKKNLNWMKNHPRIVIVFFWWKKLHCDALHQLPQLPVPRQRHQICGFFHQVCPPAREVPAPGHDVWPCL